MGRIVNINIMKQHFGLQTVVFSCLDEQNACYSYSTASINLGQNITFLFLFSGEGRHIDSLRDSMAWFYLRGSPWLQQGTLGDNDPSNRSDSPMAPITAESSGRLDLGVDHSDRSYHTERIYPKECALCSETKHKGLFFKRVLEVALDRVERI